MDTLPTATIWPSATATLDAAGNWQPKVGTPDTGYVVVSLWTPSRYASTRYSYEYFETLPKAVIYHRRIVAGLVRDEEPRGIFASAGGLPTGGPLSAEAIAAVDVDLNNWRRNYASPNSPENKHLKEAAIFNGKVPA